jgi:subtilisin-like proprotein convertase family protein
MRDMAVSITQAADKLFPGEPHKDTFLANFKRHKIIADPEAELVLNSVRVQDKSGSSRIDPGDSFDLSIELKNLGKIEASTIRGELRSLSKNAKVQKKKSEYPNIDSEMNATNLKPFRVRVKDNHACGVPLEFLLSLDYEGSKQLKTKFKFEVKTGWAVGYISEDNTDEMDIPDGLGENDSGIESEVEVSYQAKVGYDFGVYIKLKHDYVGDLIIKLMSPSGKVITLFHNPNFEAPLLEGTFGKDIKSKDNLRKMIGEDLNGTWKLLIMDLEREDKGTLLSWGIRSSTVYQCE